MIFFRLKCVLALSVSFLLLSGGCDDKKDDPRVDPELAAAPGELSFECDETVTKKTVTTYNTVIDSDHDGLPGLWEKANGLDSNDPSDGKTTTLTGGTYTNLEVYLYDLIREK